MQLRSHSSTVFAYTAHTIQDIKTGRVKLCNHANEMHVTSGVKGKVKVL